MFLKVTLVGEKTANCYIGHWRAAETHCQLTHCLDLGLKSLFVKNYFRGFSHLK